MLDKTQPFPSTWTSPPELNSFVVEKDAAADSAAYGPVGGSASPSAEAGQETATTVDSQAAAASATGGAGESSRPNDGVAVADDTGRLSSVSMGALLGAVGLAVACLW